MVEGRTIRKISPASDVFLFYFKLDTFTSKSCDLIHLSSSYFVVALLENACCSKEVSTQIRCVGQLQVKRMAFCSPEEATILIVIIIAEKANPSCAFSCALCCRISFSLSVCTIFAHKRLCSPLSRSMPLLSPPPPLLLTREFVSLLEGGKLLFLRRRILLPSKEVKQSRIEERWASHPLSQIQLINAFMMMALCCLLPRCLWTAKRFLSSATHSEHGWR